MYGKLYAWIASNFPYIIILGILCFCFMTFLYPTGKKSRLMHFLVGIAGVVYIAILFYVTLGMRSPGVDYDYNFHLFWSYQRIKDTGSSFLLWENIANVIAFIPFGMFLSEFFREKMQWWKCALCGILLSSMIELIQLFFKLGLCEFDDIFHNTIGAMLGFLFAVGIKKLFGKNK